MGRCECAERLKCKLSIKTSGFWCRPDRPDISACMLCLPGTMRLTLTPFAQTNLTTVKLVCATGGLSVNSENIPFFKLHKRFWGNALLHLFVVMSWTSSLNLSIFFNDPHRKNRSESVAVLRANAALMKCLIVSTRPRVLQMWAERNLADVPLGSRFL